MNLHELVDLFPEFYKEVDPTPNESLLRVIDTTLNSLKIPSILHYIWLGKAPFPETSRANMAHFAKMMKDFGGSVFFWTDQTSPLPEFCEWLKSNSIHLINVDSVFGKNDLMDHFFQYRCALAKIPPNYGEASDLLRYEILDRFGGYYFDHDVKKEDIDLKKLISKARNNQCGFVCGLATDTKSYLRNDIFGLAPRHKLIKKIKLAVTENYNTMGWKNKLKFKRSLSTEYTVLTTGPDVFGITVEEFFNLNSSISVSAQKGILDKISINSLVGISAEAWGHTRINAKSIQISSDPYWPARVEHDLIVSLLSDSNVLDLEKYQICCGAEALPQVIPIVHTLLKEQSKLFESVDRIFVKDVNLYVQMQELLQKHRGKKIEWNELAVFRFACLMGSNELITHLSKNTKLDIFDTTFAYVAHYDCSNAQPLSILIERSNLEIIQKLLPLSNLKKARSNLAFNQTGLIYAGRPYAFLGSNSQLALHKIDGLKQRKQAVSAPEELEQLEQEINRLEAIQRLLTQYGVA